MGTDTIVGKAEAHISLDENKKQSSEKLLKEAHEGRGSAHGRSNQEKQLSVSGEAGAKLLPELTIENERQQNDTPEAIGQKKAEIERKYGVHFETTDTCPPDAREKLREPTMKELEIVDWALAKNQGGVKPNAFGRNELTIMFSKDPEGCAAYHSGDTNEIFGHSRIVISSSEKVLTTEDTKEGQSLGSVLMHELGHRSDYMAPRDIEQLGWKQVGPNNDDVAIETKDGRLYKFVEEKNDKGERTGCHWSLCDSHGQLMEDQPQGRVTDDQMRDMERVAQPMRPANNPAETFANASRMFKQNEETRRELREKCPDMYSYLEKYDRQELGRLGRDFFGNNDYVRDRNGDIVRNPNAWNPALM